MVRGWYATVGEVDEELMAIVADGLALLGPDDDGLRAHLLAEQVFALGTSLGRQDEALAVARRPSPWPAAPARSGH